MYNNINLDKNYLDKPYVKMQLFTDLKNIVRKHAKSGHFHILIISDKYLTVLMQFLRTYYPNPDVLMKTSKMRNLNIVVSNNALESRMESSKVLVHPNSLMKREQLENYFRGQIKQIMGIDNHPFPLPKEEWFTNNVNSNPIFGSFDSLTDNSSEKPAYSYLPLEELTFKELNSFFVIMPPDTHIKGFYLGMQQYFSQQSEISESVDKRLN